VSQRSTFQLNLRDIFLVTAIVAAVVASIARQEIRIALLTLAIFPLVIWRRPVVMRVWIVTAAGFGSGLLMAMLYVGMWKDQYIRELGAMTAELAGWGAGLVVGTLSAWRLFLSNPPSREPMSERKKARECFVERLPWRTGRNVS
jgi:hypothetical protein